MTNYELIRKLNNLKNVNPDKTWLESNRDLLLSQVSNSGAKKLSVWQVSLINVSSFMKSASRPAYALGAFVLLLLTGSLFSGQLLASTKPNDSLYIARIISEKVQLNTTFNSAARTKMQVKFASNHARDISAVLADPSFNNEANQDQVARLNTSFTKEVNTVKSNMSRLNAAMVLEVKVKADEVIIADSSKDDQGIQLSEGVASEVTIAAVSEPAGSADATATLAVAANLDMGTTSVDVAATSTADKMAPSEADKMLDEVQQLFDSKDYQKASDKLQEVSASLE